MHPYIWSLGLLYFISHHQEVRDVRSLVWDRVYEEAVTNIKRDHPDLAQRNREYLNSIWSAMEDFYVEMIYTRRPGITWSNPMHNYNPSSVTTANGKLCHIIVALNEIRVFGASAKYGQQPGQKPSINDDEMEALMMFAAHVLEWLAPDKLSLHGPPW